ncbi:uncharacterized protein [Chelonus insularis]|uniref:uncharacterized protein isoform X2 n=1 Tax=Chelonus insularis TaxID=460826 RepID=UPI0015891AAC|nr:uncharacterized protein LOC118072016 isoform X2 [Chelonus insularis]
MKIITSIIIITYLVTLINTHPISKNEGLRSKTLEHVVVTDKDEDPALRGKRTIGVLRQFFPDITKDVNPEAENQVSDGDVAESQKNEIKVQFGNSQTDSINEASEPGLAPLEEIQVTDDDENRNKRFLNFGFGSSNLASGGGSGGGSGNFLFDIIRLVAGSGSQPSDSSSSAGRTEEAVPGPITRLFVIANRGISNLIQDLILRLAATSERFVNFKARLITSII